MHSRSFQVFYFRETHHRNFPPSVIFNGIDILVANRSTMIYEYQLNHLFRHRPFVFRFLTRLIGVIIAIFPNEAHSLLSTLIRFHYLPAFTMQIKVCALAIRLADCQDKWDSDTRLCGSHFKRVIHQSLFITRDIAVNICVNWCDQI